MEVDSAAAVNPSSLPQAGKDAEPASEDDSYNSSSCALNLPAREKVVTDSPPSHNEVETHLVSSETENRRLNGPASDTSPSADGCLSTCTKINETHLLNAKTKRDGERQNGPESDTFRDLQSTGTEVVEPHLVSSDTEVVEIIHYSGADSEEGDTHFLCADTVEVEIQSSGSDTDEIQLPTAGMGEADFSGGYTEEVATHLPISDNEEVETCLLVTSAEEVETHSPATNIVEVETTFPSSDTEVQLHLGVGDAGIVEDKLRPGLSSNTGFSAGKLRRSDVNEDETPLSLTSGPCVSAGSLSFTDNENVNPFMCTLPSMQLRGGQCAHERIKTHLPSADSKGPQTHLPSLGKEEIETHLPSADTDEVTIETHFPNSRTEEVETCVLSTGAEEIETHMSSTDTKEIKTNLSNTDSDVLVETHFPSVSTEKVETDVLGTDTVKNETHLSSFDTEEDKTQLPSTSAKEMEVCILRANTQESETRSSTDMEQVETPVTATDSEKIHILSADRQKIETHFSSTDTGEIVTHFPSTEEETHTLNSDTKEVETQLQSKPKEDKGLSMDSAPIIPPVSLSAQHEDKNIASFASPVLFTPQNDQTLSKKGSGINSTPVSSPVLQSAQTDQMLSEEEQSIYCTPDSSPVLLSAQKLDSKSTHTVSPLLLTTEEDKTRLPSTSANEMETRVFRADTQESETHSSTDTEQVETQNNWHNKSEAGTSEGESEHPKSKEKTGDGTPRNTKSVSWENQTDVPSVQLSPAERLVMVGLAKHNLETSVSEETAGVSIASDSVSEQASDSDSFLPARSPVGEAETKMSEEKLMSGKNQADVLSVQPSPAIRHLTVGLTEIEPETLVPEEKSDVTSGNDSGLSAGEPQNQVAEEKTDVSTPLDVSEQQMSEDKMDVNTALDASEQWAPEEKVNVSIAMDMSEKQVSEDKIDVSSATDVLEPEGEESVQSVPASSADERETRVSEEKRVAISAKDVLEREGEKGEVLSVQPLQVKDPETLVSEEKPGVCSMSEEEGGREDALSVPPQQVKESETLVSEEKTGVSSMSEQEGGREDFLSVPPPRVKESEEKPGVVSPKDMSEQEGEKGDTLSVPQLQSKEPETLVPEEILGNSTAVDVSEQELGKGLLSVPLPGTKEPEKKVLEEKPGVAITSDVSEQEEDRDSDSVLSEPPPRAKEVETMVSEEIRDVSFTIVSEEDGNDVLSAPKSSAIEPDILVSEEKLSVGTARNVSECEDCGDSALVPVLPTVSEPENLVLEEKQGISLGKDESKQEGEEEDSDGALSGPKSSAVESVTPVSEEKLAVRTVHDNMSETVVDSDSILSEPASPVGESETLVSKEKQDTSAVSDNVSHQLIKSGSIPSASELDNLVSGENTVVCTEESDISEQDFNSGGGVLLPETRLHDNLVSAEINNPLVRTQPSVQLGGGRCEHEKGNDTTVSELPDLSAASATGRTTLPAVRSMPGKREGAVVGEKLTRKVPVQRRHVHMDSILERMEAMRTGAPCLPFSDSVPGEHEDLVAGKELMHKVPEQGQPVRMAPVPGAMQTGGLCSPSIESVPPAVEKELTLEVPEDFANKQHVCRDFALVSTLARKKRKRKSKSGRQYICTECGKPFASPGGSSRVKADSHSQESETTRAKVGDYAEKSMTARVKAAHHSQDSGMAWTQADPHSQDSGNLIKRIKLKFKLRGDGRSQYGETTRVKVWESYTQDSETSGNKDRLDSQDGGTAVVKAAGCSQNSGKAKVRVGHRSQDSAVTLDRAGHDSQDGKIAMVRAAGHFEDSGKAKVRVGHHLQDSRTTMVNPFGPGGPCGPWPTGTSGVKRVKAGHRSQGVKNGKIGKVGTGSQNRVLGKQKRETVKHVCSMFTPYLTSSCAVSRYVGPGTDRVQYWCKRCGEPFGRGAKILHVTVHCHADRKLILCQYCHASFRRPAALTVHIMQAHTYGAETTTKRKPLKRKQKAGGITGTANKRQRVSMQPLTRNAFSSDSSLMAHGQKFSRNPSFLGQSQKSQDSVSSAVTAHTHRRPCPKKPCACTDCGVQVLHTGKQMSHKPRQQGKGRHRCLLCEAAFVRARDLKAHLRSKHTDTRRLISSEGSATISSSERLTTDTQRHTAADVGEKSFVCGRCGAAFVSEASLMTHMNRHTIQRPHICRMCSAAFAQSTNLALHMRTHTSQTLPKSSFLEHKDLLSFDPQMFYTASNRQ